MLVGVFMEPLIAEPHGSAQPRHGSTDPWAVPVRHRKIAIIRRASTLYLQV